MKLRKLKVLISGEEEYIDVTNITSVYCSPSGITLEINSCKLISVRRDDYNYAGWGSLLKLLLILFDISANDLYGEGTNEV
jgi:hypothetical protein